MHVVQHLGSAWGLPRPLAPRQPRLAGGLGRALLLFLLLCFGGGGRRRGRRLGVAVAKADLDHAQQRRQQPRQLAQQQLRAGLCEQDSGSSSTKTAGLQGSRSGLQQVRGG